MPTGDPITLRFEPLRFSTTLSNAELRYRLILTNQTTRALEPVVIRGAIIAAAPGLPARARDAPLLHTIAALGAGETLEIAGRIIVPLGQIAPMMLGGARLLVPLVALSVAASDGGGALPVARWRFLIGDGAGDDGAPDAAKGVQPFALAGPRHFGAVTQRRLEPA